MDWQLPPQAVTPDDDRAQKLWSLIKDIDIAMLTTVDGGHLRARPMYAIQDRFDGTLRFLTRLSSAKTGEIGNHPQVGLAFGDPKNQNYVSLSGPARLGRDRDRIAQLWREPMRTWFPKGLDDPDLGLLEVEVELAEYWDTPSSAMVHLYGYVKAATTGKSPDPGSGGLGEHEQVSFQHSPNDQPGWGV